MTHNTGLSRPMLYGLVAVTCAVALQYSAPADAHWRRGGGGGWFFGGLVVGAALAPRYVYPAPTYYYPPPAYYAPPPVVYTQPPVIVQQPAPPVVVAPPPVSVPQAQASSIEDRLRRLRSLCDQGLITAQECQVRREEVLREL